VLQKPLRALIDQAFSLLEVVGLIHGVMSFSGIQLLCAEKAARSSEFCVYHRDLHVRR